MHPKIAILATGNEVVYGDTLNTNTHKIAGSLSENGLNILTHVSCCDDLDAMQKAFAYLKDHQIIITIGGLGPTSDDLTRFAVAHFLNEELVVHEQAIRHINSYLAPRNQAFSPLHQQEALFPKKAKLLNNPTGTALGAWIETASHVVVMLPGPSNQCTDIWEESVLPRLKKKLKKDRPWIKWRLFATLEADIAPLLEEALKAYDVQIGYRIEMPYLEIKVKPSSQQERDVRRLLDKLLGPFVITPDLRRASVALKAHLMAHPMELSMEDKLTGGLLESSLSCPTLYPYLSFRAQKSNHIVLTGLNDYWEMKKSGVEISFHLQGHLNDKVLESHYTPRYSGWAGPYAPHFALEWACATILHFLLLPK